MTKCYLEFSNDFRWIRIFINHIMYIFVEMAQKLKTWLFSLKGELSVEWLSCSELDGSLTGLQGSAREQFSKNKLKKQKWKNLWNVFLSFFPSQGGAFYFMEHVAAERSTWNSFWQQVLDPVWPLLFDGCRLTRESWKTLERAGFSKLKLQHIQAPLSWELVRPHIYGYAVK